MYAAANMNIKAFQTVPIVLQPPLLRQMAISLSPMPGFALEFGVFQGDSIRQLALASPCQHFYESDSFEGLPEPWRRSPGNTCHAGHFAVPRLPFVPNDESLIRGFIDQALPPWLEKNSGPVGFVHIDCELYRGAKTILAALSDHLAPGAAIVLDKVGEWERNGVSPNRAEGEWRALREWLAETDMRIRILDRGAKYQAAIQVWHDPPSHAKPQTLNHIRVVWDCGDTTLAKRPISTVWEDKMPRLPADHLTLFWDDCANPDQTFDRIARIWAQAMISPGSGFADLHLVRARVYLQTGQLLVASCRIRDYLNARPYSVPGTCPAINIARACKDYEREERLSRCWYMLTGNLEASAAENDYSRMSVIHTEFSSLHFSALLVQDLPDTRQFQTVLDIGRGSGGHARASRAAGKHVTKIDYGRSIYAEAHPEEDRIDLIVDDSMEVDFAQKFDSVFVSHVLEHQKNVHAYLLKIHSIIKNDSVLGITVPPMKPQIVVGNLSLWNAGLLLYNLVLARFACWQAWVRTQGYNVSIALKNKSMWAQGLAHDSGDVGRRAFLLPEGLSLGFGGLN